MNRGSACKLCDKRIPVRVTYLYEPDLNGWICKECWNNKYNSVLEKSKKGI